MYIGDFIGRSALYFPDRPAVVDAGRGAEGRFSYRQLDERARRAAAWLRQRHGVRRGDRVGLLAHNGVEYLDLFFACGKLGAVFVPFNFRLHPRELGELVRVTAPRVLLCGAEFAPAAAALGSAAPPVVIDGADLADRAPPSALPLDDPGLREEDIACLLFTGGTTGTARGARISYRMIAWNTLTTAIHELSRDDVTLTHTPMFHTGGLLVYTVPLLILGGTVVLMRRWDPEQMLSLVERERVTMFFAVPTQYQQLALSPRFSATDFSRVRFMTSGGAPLPVPLLDAYRQVHGTPFKQGFGMTEFGPGVFSMGPEHAVAKAGSIGRPNYFVEARLVDDGGSEVATGAAGELLLRGPACCSGYFGDADGSAIDADGWFHTGDLACRDADGFYYIVDRKKDMFISGGENVYPLEIERALHGHPAVQLCAVVGVPDERWGQAGRAFVVLRPGAATSIGPAELLAYLRERLARYKVPKAVVLRDALPLSPAGKVLKRELVLEAISV